MAVVPVPFTWVSGAAPSAATLNGTTGPKGGLDFLLSPPRVSVYKSASASLSNNTWTLVTWDSEFYDTDSMHSTSSNTSRLVATTPGLYAVTANVYFAGNTSGTRGINFTPNGAGTRDADTLALSDSHFPATISGDRYCSAAFEWQAAANDYLEMHVLQSSGGALNLVGGNAWTHVTMRWVASS